MGEYINKYGALFEDALFIEMLNKIITEAVEHGSDGHGAYCVNRDGLVNAMSDLLRWTGGCKSVGVMDEDGENIQFYLKRHIVTDV